MAEESGRSANKGTMAFAIMVGGVIEWYDFNLFGIASALVFGKLFFPTYSTFAGTLLSFGTFAVAWLARPIGGIVFATIGDRIGRKGVLLTTFMTMGLCTTVIGALPTYQQVGVWAPLILVVLRIMQGLAAGGEWSGAASMALEYAPEGRKGFFGGFAQISNPISVVLANAVSIVFYTLPEEDLLAYGWRIPFLVSIVVVFIGALFRAKVHETPEFEVEQKKGRLARWPVIEAIRESPRTIGKVFFAVGGMNAVFWTFATFALSYAVEQAGYTRTWALIALMTGAAFEMVATIPCAALSDRIGRGRMYGASMIFFAIGIWPFFWMINQGSNALLVVAFVIFFGVPHAFSWSVASSLFTEVFPTRTRYSGSALPYQLAGTVFGGPLPIVATLLVGAGGGAPWAFCGLFAVVTVIAGVAAWRLKVGSVAAEPGDQPRGQIAQSL